jgi:hypothetical protein
LTSQVKAVFDFDERSFREFQKAAMDLAPEVGRNAWRAAIDKGVRDLIEEMRSTLKTQTKDSSGRLGKALHKKIDKKREPWFWKGSVAVRMGNDRKDPRGAFYWHMAEYGHAEYDFNGKPTGGRVPGIGFVDKAMRAKSQIILNQMVRDAKRALENRWKRIPKGRVK